MAEIRYVNVIDYIYSFKKEICGAAEMSFWDISMLIWDILKFFYTTHVRI